MQVALVVADHDRRGRLDRRADAAQFQAVVAPDFRTVPLPHRDHDTLRLGDEKILGIDAETPIARHVVSPPDLSGVERQHGGPALESRREHVIADHSHRGVDIDQPVELGSAMRRGQCGIPHRVAGIQIHRHHLAVVKPADGQVLDDDRGRRAAQAQTRHLLLDRPQFLAGGDIEAVQTAIDRAHHHHLLADRRRREQLRIDVRAPFLGAGRRIERDDLTLAGADDDQTEPCRRTRRQRLFEFLEPDLVAGIHVHGDHFTLVGCGKHHPVRERRPEAETQLHLFLAAADVVAPDFLDRQRVVVLGQVGWRLDIFILAAGGNQQKCRKTQGKQ